ncbi:hypothetical protein PIB30_039478 [Stylosanthes scabra]|uniref:Uncharacterized protein n=1 Tax=Stylosanthes scabra TaxID=79078 RepID=A0ABU6XFL0_9FABA|nr:hypothetical protein [Stylosanthes scabra]
MIKEKAVAFQDAKAKTKSEGLLPMEISLCLIPRLMMKGESAWRKVKIDGDSQGRDKNHLVMDCAAQKAKECGGDAAEGDEVRCDAAQETKEKVQAYVSGVGEYNTEKASERKGMAAQRPEHPIQRRMQMIYGLFYQQLLQAVLMASSLPAKATACSGDLHGWWTLIKIGMLSHP